MGSEKQVQVLVRLPADLARRLKIEAAKRETTVRALVEDAVRAYLNPRKER